MIALVLATALSAAPVKLAAPGFQSVNLRNELTYFLTNDFTNRLREQGLEVVSEKDISTMLGIERQQELMGCAPEGSNCITELADALGVDGVITGSVAKFGDHYRVLITVVSSTNAKPLATYSDTVVGQKNVFAALAEAAAQMAPQILTALHCDPIRVSAPATPPSRSRWGFISAGGAIAFAGVAAGLFLAAEQEDALLKCDPGQPCAATPQQAQAAHDHGQLLQGLAIGSAAASAVCAGLAIWLFARSDDAPAVSFWLAPTSLGLTARW